MLDTPPRLETAALEAARVADLVVVPCRLQMVDLETVPTTTELLALARDPLAVAVLVAVPPRGAGTSYRTDTVAITIHVDPEIRTQLKMLCDWDDALLSQRESRRAGSVAASERPAFTAPIASFGRPTGP